MQCRSNLLVHFRKIASKALTLIFFRISRTPERKEEKARKSQSQRELSSARTGIRCNSQEIIIAEGSCHLCCVWPCIVRIHDQPLFTSLSTPINNLGESISDIVGGCEHLSFGMASMTWNPWGFQKNIGINFGLSIICFSRSRTKGFDRVHFFLCSFVPPAFRRSQQHCALAVPQLISQLSNARTR
jgi:hypothetical protein